MMKKLSERFLYYSGILAATGMIIDVDDLVHIQGLLEAEEKGLLIKLPFKIGDTLYYIDDYEIYHDKVNSFDVRKVNGEHTFCVGYMDWIYDDFGKTVFLTKKEAEEALRKKVSE